MEERPKIAVPLTSFDKIIESTAVLLLLALWIITLTNYSTLPATIPTHFNAAGQPDGYGNKASILMLPVIATIIYVGMTILNRHPHLYNYPSTITVDNALEKYTTATKVIRVLKLVVVIIFLSIVYSTVATVHKTHQGLGRWFLPFVVILVMVPNLFFFFRGKRKT